MSYTFSAKDKKQIAARFKTMFEVLTSKTWTQGVGARTPEDEDGVCEEFDWDEVPIKGEKGTPKMDAFCLMGAVRYINGPTEEEITALMATQIVMMGKGANLPDSVEDLLDRDDDLSKPERALAIFSTFMAEEQEHTANVIVHFNDHEAISFADVSNMLKKAQTLYDKLWAVSEAKKAIKKIKIA